MNVIDIKHATARYGSYHALDDFNWEVKAGEHWFILGANGAGKTTLVKMLMGIKWPIFGAEINILGCRFGQANLVEMRKRIAWMSPFLLKWTSPETSSLEVVLSGIDATMGMLRDAEPEEIARAEKLMSDFNCLKLSDHKFDTLSSGEQLKVMICRALIPDPELLIFDEACVHLDMKSREHLLDCITEMAVRKNSPTILFITQRIEDVTKVFKKGMILKDGKILAIGDRNTILTEENLSKTFDMPLKLHNVLDDRLWATPV